MEKWNNLKLNMKLYRETKSTDKKEKRENKTCQ